MTYAAIMAYTDGDKVSTPVFALRANWPINSMPR